MGLHEDMEDLCAGMAEKWEELAYRRPSQEVENLLALKARYHTTDSNEFVDAFRQAASDALVAISTSNNHTRKTVSFGLPLQSVYFHLMLELGLQERFKSELTSREEDLILNTLQTIGFLLEQKPHLFNRDMLIFVQDFGRKYARVWRDHARTSYLNELSINAAQARSRVVLLKLAMKETPEIAEHGDEITTRLTALGAEQPLLETLRLAVVSVTPHASEAVLAGSIDRSRAFLEEMLRFLRRLLESKGHVASVTSEPVTAREILNSLSKIFASHEDELFQKFFNLISVKGSHTTSALLNQARLARNLTIELAFYVLEKVRQEYGIG